uniref:Uncharacterized protein n=1 Tax=Ditylenchus dipsaci TaxID=166011 RepID=A0A915EKW5_9BILA
MALRKFIQSWLLREDYHRWFFRFVSSIGVGMSSLPTSNGFEGTNKQEYTQRELTGISRNLSEFQQFLNVMHLSRGNQR